MHYVSLIVHNVTLHVFFSLVSQVLLCFQFCSGFHADECLHMKAECESTDSIFVSVFAQRQSNSFFFGYLVD